MEGCLRIDPLVHHLREPVGLKLKPQRACFLKLACTAFGESTPVSMARTIPIPATSAMIAAQRHEDAMSIWLIATNHWSGGSDWRKVRPETSDRVSGMSRAAAIAHAMLIHEEICCAR